MFAPYSISVLCLNGLSHSYKGGGLLPSFSSFATPSTIS
jgi:hypothetical protein